MGKISPYGAVLYLDIPAAGRLDCLSGGLESLAEIWHITNFFQGGVTIYMIK